MSLRIRLVAQNRYGGQRRTRWITPSTYRFRIVFSLAEARQGLTGRFKRAETGIVKMTEVEVVDYSRETACSSVMCGIAVLRADR
jgi:hypothetical protein